MPLTRLQAAGEFIEVSAKILADELTIVLLKEGGGLKLSEFDKRAFRHHQARCGRLLDGLIEMSREMKK